MSGKFVLNLLNRFWSPDASSVIAESGECEVRVDSEDIRFSFTLRNGSIYSFFITGIMLVARQFKASVSENIYLRPDETAEVEFRHKMTSAERAVIAKSNWEIRLRGFKCTGVLDLRIPAPVKIETEPDLAIESEATPPLVPVPAAIDEFDIDGRLLTPLERAQKRVIVEYLQRNRYNQGKTSRELGIRANTIIAKIRKYGIEIPGGQKRGRKSLQRSLSKTIKPENAESETRASERTDRSGFAAPN
jgi:hypothetical protein